MSTNDFVAEQLNGLATPQPPPEPSDGVSITDLFLRLIPQWQEERAAAGVKKYGVKLQSNNGRDALADATQEMLDAQLYLLQAAVEREQDKKTISLLEVQISQTEYASKIAWGETQRLTKENNALKQQLEVYRGKSNQPDDEQASCAGCSSCHCVVDAGGGDPTFPPGG